jgi:hypothetical protein
LTPPLLSKVSAASAQHNRTFAHPVEQQPNLPAGVKPYTAAVATLFDAATSRADLIDLSVVDDKTIVLRWRLEGALRIGGLKIKPYTGTTTYTLNPDGLIASHVETWDISTVDAFVSTFFPGLQFGAPPAPPV